MARNGEALTRSAFAHEVDALVRLAGLSLGAACRQALGEVRLNYRNATSQVPQ
jgi:isoaspartyl peptidase/L-asparaginase-like protein (Ntn-hydrolase superfamily)